MPINYFGKSVIMSISHILGQCKIGARNRGKFHAPQLLHTAPYFRGKVIAYEGLPGVGKTTACQAAVSAMEGWGIAFHDIQEKIDQNILSQFLSDPGKYGGLFQTYCFCNTSARLATAWEKIANDPTAACCVDRSIDGNVCFEQVNHALGNIDDATHKFYEAMMADKAKAIKGPTFSVYFDTSAAIALDRIKARANSAEAGYQLSYLKKLELAHVRWALTAKQPVLVIAYDQYPPRAAILDIQGAFLRALEKKWERPQIFSGRAALPAHVTELDDTLDAEMLQTARNTWTAATVVDRWCKSPKINEVVRISDPTAPDFWRRVMFYLMMRVHVYCPSSSDTDLALG